MTDAKVLDQIRPGMQVHTADRKKLGKVRRVHTREAESYMEVASEKALWKFWQLELKALFLPATAVRSVEGSRVHLQMDAKTARGCIWRPAWISVESLGDYVGRPGTGT